ncbi:TPA: prepilin, shufflon protein A [Salmonella enterica]|nr:prepilin, shufflon protein A [Salmonella enterica]
MHSNILISYIFTDVKCLNIKVQPIRTPNTGLALGQTCQSGIWRYLTSADGIYVSVGVFKGVYRGSNTSGKQLKIYASGGNPPPKKINFGNSDDCVNTFSLIASVGRYTVAKSVDGNSQWGKSGNIVFDVPDGASFTITSNGMMSYGCDYGTFSVFSYQ